MKKFPLHLMVCILIFTACKKESVNNDPAIDNKENKSATTISFDKDAMAFLEENYDNIAIRDSVSKVIMNSLTVNGEKPADRKMTNARSFSINSVDDNGIYGNANDDGMNTSSFDQGTFLGGDAINGFSHNMRFSWFLTKRQNLLVVTTHIEFSPISVVIGTPAAFVIGPAVGSFETPAPPYANAAISGNDVQGNGGGDLIEKRTVIVASNGNVIITGGLNAGLYQVGAEISSGVTVTESSNRQSNFNYDFTFTLIPGIIYNSAPVITWQGTGRCYGS
ncbi:hypothetical protein GFS24_25075 [Chitinophaga sp. SYP-B3965]|uniref:hypothetical protein n=1 Tax=Chitinophaga sp. SYP-B3965 TaxID=2663120 RepID=UPI0012998362|nr:hypothetical protein [Chitinophaga sp. SYP-B3965]MRG48412.1 hypothetical protein [Chitinophaga sp. SYP-B3965]